MNVTALVFKRNDCLKGLWQRGRSHADNVLLNQGRGRGTQLAVLLALLFMHLAENYCRAEFQAGTAIIDVTPTTFPVIVNGGFTSRTATSVNTRLHARALALSNDTTKIVIVVVDSCMMPRPLLDEAKRLASQRTGIPTQHMLISATHTHTAGSCMGALGTPADENYVPLLRAKIADAISAAAANLRPARVGFARANAAEYTAPRRWIRRPDRVELDPFGNRTVRATMHAGKNWDDVTGESGPEDPELTLLSVQTQDGKPLAVLANFSMHYFSGESQISADYFGRFCGLLADKVAPGTDFLGIMSHGCSGDIWRRDYTRPESWDAHASINEFADGLANIAHATYQRVDYRDDVELAMLERRMSLKYRVPDQQRLEWAQRIVDAMGDRLPKTRTEVYAMEQVILHQRQQTDIVVQALRVGDIAIATTPNETYAITGLKIKAASPLEKTMIIELANGGDGYIPPPEQHLFGGYNTWAARSAGLEVTAEPKIAEACIDLLEQVTGIKRRVGTLRQGPASQRIAALAPQAWYRLNEFAGPRAHDSSGHRQDGILESAVTYYLEGPHSNRFCGEGQTNRAIMFVGGRLRTRLPSVANFSISLWLWNGMPSEGRDVSGWILSRGHDHGLAPYSEHLGIGGTAGRPGRLIYQYGATSDQIVAGSTEIRRWTWQHLALVRERGSVRVYLNGDLELETQSPVDAPDDFDRLFVGGRSDNSANWEGRLDEVAIFDRALNADEIRQLAK